MSGKLKCYILVASFVTQRDGERERNRQIDRGKYETNRQKRMNERKGDRMETEYERTSLQ